MQVYGKIKKGAILVAIQDGTMMSNLDKDQDAQIQARALNYMRNTLIRGEQAEERMLDEILERLRKEKAQKEQN